MGENRKYNNTITINKIGRKYRKYENTIQLQVIRWEIQGNTERR